MALVGAIGLAGNLMSLVVLMRPKLRDASFNQACSDNSAFRKILREMNWKTSYGTLHLHNTVVTFLSNPGQKVFTWVIVATISNASSNIMENLSKL